MSQQAIEAFLANPNIPLSAKMRVINEKMMAAEKK